MYAGRSLSILFLSSSQLLCLWILAFCCCLKFLLLKKVYRSTSAIICWTDFFFFKNPAKKRRHSSARIRGYMSLSANWLEYGHHVARLRRRRRRAYAPTSNTASHDSHKENPSWVSFSFPWCLWGSAGRPFGPPELRYYQIVISMIRCNFLQSLKKLCEGGSESP